MKFEPFISRMLEMNVLGRLWHWSTDSAQHHVTFETFLTQNETFTDSFVESALGNDLGINFSSFEVTAKTDNKYNLDHVKDTIKNYRSQVHETQQALESSDFHGKSELVTVLDDVIELCSKTLYLLKLK